jgi:radical SAM superfamily enzyme YgiQ (UPF0313 family)
MGQRVLLLLPPFFTPLTPPLGISILKSFLEGHGHSVTCFDFNTRAQQWNRHHQYFARLQALEDVGIQDGYSKLWHILNDHALMHVNGASPREQERLLPRIVEHYGLRHDATVIKDLVRIVGEHFGALAAAFEQAVDVRAFDWVGTSTYTTSLSASLFLLREIKRRHSAIKTVMGGGVFADDLATGSDNLQTLIDEYPWVDHIVLGEGEQLLLRLLNGELAQRVVSLADIGRSSLPMGAVPLPAFGDFDMREYYHLTIEGARSCPFQCSFCSETIQWGDYRKKPARALAAQMLELAKRHGRRSFFMGDSLMNPYIDELARALLEQNADLRYDGYLRADRLGSPEVQRQRTRAWSSSGCFRVRLGIETAANNVLKLMEKMTTRDTIAQALVALANAGIRTTTYWIVGYPGESAADFQETLDFIREHHRYIYELEAHPHLYYPYGQVASRQFASRSLYSEEVTRFTRFKKWEIDGVTPGREERFERLRRICDLGAELGLANIYTEEARYRAERRWLGLHPLAVEIDPGTAPRRAPLAPLAHPFKPACARPEAAA